MNLEKAVERSFAIVDRALRKSFPEDFHKRCMYAAFGLQVLLKELGFEANILGGDMLVFMVSRSQQQAGMQGFAAQVEGCAHYWVEVGDRLLDIGPHYLHRDARFPAAGVPLIAWDRTETIPPFLRYRVLEDFGSSTTLVTDDVIGERMEAFLDLCRRKLRAQMGQPKPPYWMLTGSASLLDHGRKGDLWVHNAMRFASAPGAVAHLPF